MNKFSNRMKIFKIFKIIYYIFLAALALIALLLIVSRFSIPGNFKVMTVLSGSMTPAIKMGGVVAVKPADDYKIGQVITFYRTGVKSPITHRISDIKVEGGEPVYITKGDANNAPDIEEVKKKDIVGKVLFSIPYIGYAVETAKKPIGFMFIIVVPAVIIIYDEIRKLWRELKKFLEKKKNSV